MTSADGKDVSSPRTFLADRIGQIGFDPFEFINQKSEAQVKFVMKLLGLNFDDLNARRKKIYDDRTAVNKSIKDLTGWINEQKVPEHEFKTFNKPKDLVAIKALGQDAEKKNTENAGIRQLLVNIKAERESKLTQDKLIQDQVNDWQKQIDDLKLKIKEKQDAGALIMQEVDKLDERIKLGETAVAALKDVDTSEFNTKFEDAVQFNKKVETVQKVQAKLDEKAQFEALADDYKDQIDNIDKEKMQLINDAPWPIPGMSMTDDYLTLDGLPFDESQIPKSKIIDTGIRLLMATNPGVKICRIKDGSLLDDDSMKALLQVINENGFQAFVELVDKNKGGLRLEFVEAEEEEVQDATA